jgi:aspartyl-tRNA(Asn)/glutamyl-tRNA(Gln) amidotransferase subunit C
MDSSDPDSRLLDENRVRTLAKLARLELPDAQIQGLTADLAKILAHVDQLAELDLTGIEPTAYVSFDLPALRPDEPHASLPVDLALREAPRTSMDGFAVPAYVDEG